MMMYVRVTLLTTCEQYFTGKPKFVEQPGDQEVPEDEKCYFAATVTGKPAPVVEW